VSKKLSLLAVVATSVVKGVKTTLRMARVRR
jgi:hypothetical protein